MNNFVELIHKGETESLEFKESLRLKEELGQAISAFSNANGGSILIGISDAGTCIGVEIGRNTLEELANYIKRNTDPAIFPSMKTEQIEKKKIVRKSQFSSEVMLTRGLERQIKGFLPAK